MRSRRARCGHADHLLDHLASRLLRAPASSLPDELGAALAAIGRRVRADRVTLRELPHVSLRDLPRPGGPAALHQWSRAGCAPAEDAAEDLPWLGREIEAGRTVTFRSLAALPREAARERKVFARHGPRSAAILPLLAGEAPVAVLAVATLRSERSWGGATLALLARAGVVLAAALERRRAHDASFEAERRLATALDAAPDGILIARRSGRVEVANARAAAIFLRGLDDLRAARLEDLLAPAPEGARARGRGALDALLASDGPVEASARRGDGSTLPVELTVRALRIPDGDLLCCGVRDASEDRRARQEAARLRDELAFLGRTAMLAEMGAGIAHELNQPLTAILSNAETAERLLRAGRGRAGAADGDGAADDEVREALRDVVRDTRRAADVLGRMRDMLRRRDAARVPVDVAALLEAVARRFREEAVARSIRLSVEVAPGLPRVQGDPVQLEQVAMNLVLNAFDALGEPAGGPRTIALRARPAQAVVRALGAAPALDGLDEGHRRSRPDGVSVSVRDSGPGLDHEALARAFDAFFTTKPNGLGMGLPISRSIVEAHGGRLLARNNAGGGATFELHLPAAPAAATAQRKPA